MYVCVLFLMLNAYIRPLFSILSVGWYKCTSNGLKSKLECLYKREWVVVELFYNNYATLRHIATTTDGCTLLCGLSPPDDNVTPLPLPPSSHGSSGITFPLLSFIPP